jgi:DNA polymerase I-like protein with 3'-5' exonuclease and polymerase domains
MLIGMQERMIKRNMKSLIVAQIHDAITFDAVPEEIENIKSLYKEVHDDIHKQWKWLRIPIRAEMEIGEIGGSWAEMTEVGLI